MNSVTGASRVEPGVDQLLGGIAHEVRNALFATTMTLEALEASQPPSPELAGYIDSLRRQLEPLHGLVADLGLLNDPPTSGFAPASLPTLLRAASERCRPPRKTGVSVAIADANDAARVQVEQASMVRALTHMLTYALQRSATGYTISPTIQVSDAEGTPWVECTIADNGDALRPEDIEHLLDAYYPRSRGGFDARLAMARRVIEAHHGTLHAEPRSGGGVQLVMRLPLAGAAPAPGPDSR